MISLKYFVVSHSYALKISAPAANEQVLCACHFIGSFKVLSVAVSLDLKEELIQIILGR